MRKNKSRKNWKKCLTDDYVERLLTLNMVQEAKKPVKYMYAILSENIGTADMEKAIVRYNKETNTNCDEMAFNRPFRHMYKISRITKLRNFQYRFLLGKIYPNYILCRCTISLKTNWSFVMLQ